MRNKVPVIGAWYQTLKNNEMFEIVAIDEQSKTIDVQYLDGRIDEFDYTTWQSTAIEACAEPADWQEVFETEHDLNPFDETREPVDPWTLIDSIDNDPFDSDYM